MSLVQNIQDLALRVSTQNKQLATWINGNAADLSTLSTTAKASLVAAINELSADLAALEAGAGAIDDAVTSTTSTWSSSKISTTVSDTATATKNEILGGAGAAYDTLQELKALMDASDSADDDAIAAINTALANRVRTDTNAQGLTTTEQANARTNIDVYSKAEIGNPETNFVATFEAGLL